MDNLYRLNYLSLYHPSGDGQLLLWQRWSTFALTKLGSLLEYHSQLLSSSFDILINSVLSNDFFKKIKYKLTSQPKIFVVQDEKSERLKKLLDGSWKFPNEDNEPKK